MLCFTQSTFIMRSYPIVESLFSGILESVFDNDLAVSISKLLLIYIDLISVVESLL
jgi:hypothetical protein